jgi:lantibiotic modifying enzyme
LSEDLEKKLAQYAAIGDVLGRGDRHFENVIVKDGELYPIDLSYLFCENNEEWLSRYVSAGMAEFSALSFFIHDSAVLEKKIAAFFDVYSETIQWLKKEEKTILTFIKDFYGPSLETHNRCEFVKQRLTPNYVKRQKENYMQSFSELRRRLKFKQILLKIGERHLQELEAYPVLKMYFYADKDRMSAFFLSQESGYETVFRDIIYLSKRLLDLPESYFSDDVCEYVTVG